MSFSLSNYLSDHLTKFQKNYVLNITQDPNFDHFKSDPIICSPTGSTGVTKFIYVTKDQMQHSVSLKKTKVEWHESYRPLPLTVEITDPLVLPIAGQYAKIFESAFHNLLIKYGLWRPQLHTDNKEARKLRERNLWMKEYNSSLRTVGRKDGSHVYDEIHFKSKSDLTHFLLKFS